MTENFDRLRKLAGIKPKQILKESDRGLGIHSFADPDSSDFSLGKRHTPPATKKIGDRVSGRLKYGPYAGQTLTGTIVRLFPVSFAEVKWDNGYSSNANIGELSLAESAVTEKMWPFGRKQPAHNPADWAAYPGSAEGDAREDGDRARMLGRPRSSNPYAKLVKHPIWGEQATSDSDAWFSAYDADHVDESAVVESSTEYDIAKPTDVFGQFKAKPMTPDFPVDMGEVFSSGSSGESEGETLAGMDGAGEDHSEVSQPAGEETSAPKAVAEPKEKKTDDYSDYFKSDKEEAPKEEPEAKEEAEDEPKEEPKDDEGFDKKKVAEARRFYQLKRLVHRNIAEGTTDFGAAFMAGMQAFDRISDKLIVEHNINLTSEQEHKIAKAVAVELAYGKSTLDTIAESHAVEGQKQGSDYIFEFTDKAMAMIFLNEVNESGNCIGRLRYNRGFVEAVVKSFE